METPSEEHGRTVEVRRGLALPSSPPTVRSLSPPEVQQLPAPAWAQDSFMARRPAMAEPFATLEDEGRLALTTWGSSSCPTLATSWHVQDRLTLVVALGASDGTVCTADLAPTTSVLALTDDVDRDGDLTLRLRWPVQIGQGETVVIASRG